MVSNKDLIQASEQFAAGWWTSKTPAEKQWYLKFWASCNKIR